MSRLRLSLLAGLTAFRSTWRHWRHIRGMQRPSLYIEIFEQAESVERVPEPGPTVDPGYGIIDTRFGPAFQIPQSMRGRFVAGGRA